MANPNPPPPPKKHQFKPGQSGNPSGRPKGKSIPNALKAMTNQSMRRLIRIACKGNVDRLDEIIDDPGCSALEVGIARSLKKAIIKGDFKTIREITEVVLGKAPEVIEVRSKNIHVTGDMDKNIVREVMKELEDEI